MDEFVDVASVNDLAVGRARTLTIGSRTIALYHTARGFFASDNQCPHRGGPLGGGDLIADEIICPWHLWGFDVATGECPGNPELTIPTYEVRIEGESILVSVA